MKLKNVVAAGAAVCLATSAVVAQAQDQQLPSRIGSDVSEAEDLGGGGFLVPMLALIAVILGIIAATSGGDDDLPTSP